MAWCETGSVVGWISVRSFTNVRLGFLNDLRFKRVQRTLSQTDIKRRRIRIPKELEKFHGKYAG